MVRDLLLERDSNNPL
jgi:hypothetical protein